MGMLGMWRIDIIEKPDSLCIVLLILVFSL